MSEHTQDDWKKIAEMRARDISNLRQEVVILRSQLMQLQKISEHLERVYYNPMCKGFFSRIWYAMLIRGFIEHSHAANKKKYDDHRKTDQQN